MIIQRFDFIIDYNRWCKWTIISLYFCGV